MQHIVSPTLVFPKVFQEDHKRDQEVVDKVTMEHANELVEQERSAVAFSLIPIPSPSCHEDTKKNIGEKDERTVDVIIKNEDDDDVDKEGYHTPTSPRHRIPAPTNCPPAPRRAPSRLRTRRSTTKRAAAAARRGLLLVNLDCCSSSRDWGRATDHRRG